jgi:hypothetical protein
MLTFILRAQSSASWVPHLFFFPGGLEFELRVLARQVLYHLSYAPTFFCFRYFFQVGSHVFSWNSNRRHRSKLIDWDGVLLRLTLNHHPLNLASCVARLQGCVIAPGLLVPFLSTRGPTTFPNLFFRDDDINKEIVWLPKNHKTINAL